MSASFDFLQFCEEKNISFRSEGHKHTRPGWIQVECPLCFGNAGFHLGYQISADRFHCWRCGAHQSQEVVMGLLNCSKYDAAALIRKFKGRPVAKQYQAKQDKVKKVRLPTDCHRMKKRHREYLEERNFDPDILEKEWKLRGTGIMGDYKLRIIAPIYHEDKRVSYQGRDITDRSPLPYKACEEENEARHHKRCLYGLDKVEGSKVVVIEGITDVWRLGPGAVGTFGIGFTIQQVRLLRRFKEAFFLFDSVDPQAIQQAEKMAAMTSALGVISYIVEIDEDDPAKLSQKNANKLMKKLIG